MNEIAAVYPGISPDRMRTVWKQAIREAELHPGETVVISFAPGIYPMPEMGAYVYNETPHDLHVPAPGAEMHFRVNQANGRVIISAVQQKAA